MQFYGWRKTPPPDEVIVKLTRPNLGWVASGGIFTFLSGILTLQQQNTF